LIAYAERARKDVAALRRHYLRKNRVEPILALVAALNRAERRIERDPAGGLLAPRAYPELARDGWAWVNEGRYWIAYSIGTPPVILAVLYDQADMPRRL
jgi:plasmid stabilization system protein ParE